MDAGEACSPPAVAGQPGNGNLAYITTIVGIKFYSMSKNQKLELTWIGKDEQPRLEARILNEDL